MYEVQTKLPCIHVASFTSDGPILYTYLKQLIVTVGEWLCDWDCHTPMMLRVVRWYTTATLTLWPTTFAECRSGVVNTNPHCVTPVEPNQPKFPWLYHPHVDYSPRKAAAIWFELKIIDKTTLKGLMAMAGQEFIEHCANRGTMWIESWISTGPITQLTLVVAQYFSRRSRLWKPFAMQYLIVLLVLLRRWSVWWTHGRSQARNDDVLNITSITTVELEVEYCNLKSGTCFGNGCVSDKTINPYSSPRLQAWSSNHSQRLREDTSSALGGVNSYVRRFMRNSAQKSYQVLLFKMLSSHRAQAGAQLQRVLSCKKQKWMKTSTNDCTVGYKHLKLLFRLIAYTYFNAVLLTQRRKNSTRPDTVMGRRGFSKAEESSSFNCQ